MKWAWIAVIVGATTVGEVLQAMGMRKHGEIRDFRPGEIGRAMALLVRNRFVIGGVVAMAVSFFAYMGLLTIADLSFAVPATAITYVLETVLAKRLLKENVSGLRWAGAALVICGVALVSCELVGGAGASHVRLLRACVGRSPAMVRALRRPGALAGPSADTGSRSRSSSRFAVATRNFTRRSGLTPPRNIPSSKFSSASATRTIRPRRTSPGSGPIPARPDLGVRGLDWGAEY